MKTKLLTLTFILFSILSYAQTDVVAKAGKPSKSFTVGGTPALLNLQDTLTIELRTYQKQILTKLDSVQKAFAADVEKNKEVIATFNTLMQRSASIQEQSRQAQELILDAQGIDPKKFRISGGDLTKGTLKLEKIK